MKGRRSLIRPLGERRYRKLFVIATEGSKTEIQYFGMFNNEKSVIHVKCLQGKHRSAPRHVLKRMREYIEKEGLLTSDEAWLVVDKDQWDDDQLDLLFQWSKSKINYGLAVSNPKFEFWLLLHFNEGNSIGTPQQCIDRLRRFLPDYDKNIDATKIKPYVVIAVERAKSRDLLSSCDWPRSIGTTVYRLIERLLVGNG